ncbi:MAG: hypothetical protein ACHP8B_15250 [Terriglobales bacterium]
MNIDPIKRAREVDEWLESALRQYGRAEPRAGLESRVLASLQVERTRTAAPKRWWWAVGTVTALAAMVVTVWVWQSRREARPASTAGITNTTHHEVVTTHPAEGYSAKQVTTRRLARGLIRNAAVAASPKMEQFPSPQPLSDQERILMSYVARNPENAALVAQARAEALQRDREEEEAEAAKGNTE